MNLPSEILPPFPSSLRYCVVAVIDGSMAFLAWIRSSRALLASETAPRSVGSSFLALSSASCRVTVVGGVAWPGPEGSGAGRLILHWVTEWSPALRPLRLGRLLQQPSPVLELKNARST